VSVSEFFDSVGLACGVYKLLGQAIQTVRDTFCIVMSYLMKILWGTVTEPLSVLLSGRQWWDWYCSD